MTKSHVSMEQRICLVCCCKFDTGAILMHKRMRQTLEPHTTTGWGLCPEHKKLHEDDFVALVEVDRSKSTSTNGVIKPEDAYRTGNVAHLKREVWDGVFNTKAPPSTTPVVFIEQGIIEKLQSMTE